MWFKCIDISQMKNYFLLVIVSAILLTCQQDDLFKTTNSIPEIDFLSSISEGVSQPDDLIVLGERIESPYTIENMNKALASLKKIC